jgi:hypothetical protein
VPAKSKECFIGKLKAASRERAGRNGVRIVMQFTAPANRFSWNIGFPSDCSNSAHYGTRIKPTEGPPPAW